MNEIKVFLQVKNMLVDWQLKKVNKSEQVNKPTNLVKRTTLYLCCGICRNKGKFNKKAYLNHRGKLDALLGKFYFGNTSKTI